MKVSYQVLKTVKTRFLLLKYGIHKHNVHAIFQLTFIVILLGLNDVLFSLTIKVSHLLDYSGQIDLQILNLGLQSSEINTSTEL